MCVLRILKLKIIRLFRYLSINYVPRWVILLIDVAFSFIAIQFTFLLVYNIQSAPLTLTFNNGFWSLFLTQILFFLIYSSYTGIVRYTGFRDALVQFKTIASTVLTVLVINQFLFFNYGSTLMANSGVVVYGFIAFTVLYFFRIIIKRAYQLIQSTTHYENALILGTRLTDVAIAGSIISDARKKFNIIGFISEDNSKKASKIFTLPIFNMEQLNGRMIDASSVIVTSEKLTKINKDNPKFINQLLELNFKVLKLPELQDWKNDSPTAELKKVNLEDLLRRSPIKLNKSKLRSLYESRVVLVTGAGGSIGSDIVRQLIPFEPSKIILLDQAETPLHHMSVYLDKEHPQQAYEKIIADVTHLDRLRLVFENYKPEIIFHGAAYKHVPMMEVNPIEAFSVNYLGTKNLVDLSLEFKAKRFVFISTDKAVNPTNIMGASKRSAEIYVQAASRNGIGGTNFITTRFGNVLGSNGSVIPHFKKQIKHKGPVTVTHPEITRYFMTIDEACLLVLEAGAMGKGGEIFVFDMGEPVKILDLAKQMIRLTGLVPDKDIKIEFTGLRPGEKLYEELLADAENTQPTHHQKIMIAKSSFDFNRSNYELINQLTLAVQETNVLEAIRIMRELVPEYIPFIVDDTINLNVV